MYYRWFVLWGWISHQRRSLKCDKKFIQTKHINDSMFIEDLVTWHQWRHHSLILHNSDMYMLSGCELIDTENISLSSKNMKFVGEWVNANESQASYSIEQADISQYQSYLHSDDKFVILKSNINTDIWYIYWFRYLYFRGEKSHDSKYSSAFAPSKYSSRHSS